MSEKSYNTTVVALKTRKAQDLPLSMLRDADFVVIKDHRVVKDRLGMEGTISAQRLEEIKADSWEVLVVGERGEILETIEP